MAFQPKGIIPAMVTPFDEKDELSVEGTRRIIDFLIDGGVHGIFVSGSQGEFWSLSFEEKKRLFEIAVDETNGRVPVYGGTGVESTRECLDLTEMARDVGVDAVSIVTPYFINPDQTELIEHYENIANSVDIPILLYNNPGRTGGVAINPDTLFKLAENCDNIVGMKDSSGDLTTTMNYIKVCGDKISILAGRDTLIYSTLISGGRGAIAACANVAPEMVVDIYESIIKKDYGKALKSQNKILPLRNAFNLGSFPSVVKEAMELMGLPSGRCRKPIMPLSKEKKSELSKILKALNLIE